MDALKITDYLAIYAAILSSLVFLWNVLQSRPRFKVDLMFGIDIIDGISTSGASIVVRNTSPHDIHLAAIGLLFPYAKVGIKGWLLHLWLYKRWPRRLGWCHTGLSNYAINDGCPMCLEARKSHHVLVPEEIVEKVLSAATGDTIIATVQDQLWHKVYSSPFTWVCEKKV